MYASLCDLVSKTLLLLLILGFCLSVLFFVFLVFLVQFLALVIMVDLFFGSVALFFSFFLF